MKTFNLEGKEYQMVNSYEEVSLGIWMKMQGINKDLDDIRRSIEVVSILLGVETTEVMEFPNELFKDMAAEVVFFLEPHRKSETTFIISGKEYMSIDANNLTIGEIMFIKTKEEQLGYAGAIPQKLACLIRPFTKEVVGEFDTIVKKPIKFNQEEIEPRVELFMEKLMYPEFMSALGFFPSGSMI